jgi:ABC-2 type transport system ATP-binding protein
MSWGGEAITVRLGSNLALDGVDISIDRGHIHSVIGGDGAGKSTLLRVLAGLDIGQTGTIRLPPQAKIGFVPSDGGIFGDLTVGENVEFVARAHRLRRWEPRASMLLERSALHEFRDRISGRLSGGQRRKLAGVMALLAQPELVVLDELTTGVDPVSRLELWRLIAGAAADGAAVVASTTYLDEAERAESVLLLHQGRVLATGSPESIVGSGPGAISDVSTPSLRSHAWRRGRQWRQWDPDADANSDPITLEDAAIVFELSEVVSR